MLSDLSSDLPITPTGIPAHPSVEMYAEVARKADEKRATEIALGAEIVRQNRRKATYSAVTASMLAAHLVGLYEVLPAAYRGSVTLESLSHRDESKVTFTVHPEHEQGEHRIQVLVRSKERAPEEPVSFFKVDGHEVVSADTAPAVARVAKILHAYLNP